MAATAGLDERLAPFIAGYVLILAVLGPIVAGHSRWLARALQAVEGVLRVYRVPPAAPHPGASDRASEPDESRSNAAAQLAASRSVASGPNSHTPAD
jgi:CPA2 family monovalent cation:H+ antiporter-2